jgi:Peptidase family M23
LKHARRILVLVLVVAGATLILFATGQLALENFHPPNLVTADKRLTAAPVQPTPAAPFGPVDAAIIAALQAEREDKPFAVLRNVQPIGVYLPGVQPADVEAVQAAVALLASQTPTIQASAPTFEPPTPVPSETPGETPIQTVSETASAPTTAQTDSQTEPTITPVATSTAAQGPEATSIPVETTTASLTPSSTATHAVDLGILPVPTETLAPSQTHAVDLGILPTLTPTVTRTPRPTRTPGPTPTPGGPTAVAQIQPQNAAAPIPPGGEGCAPRGLPVNGVLTQRFSRWHTGIDLGVPTGTPVLATQSGTVTFAGWSYIGYGYLVTIQSGHYITYYAHNSALKVEASQEVHPGDLLALSGRTGWATGPHVHYETRIDNVPVDPLTFDARQLNTC